MSVWQVHAQAEGLRKMNQSEDDAAMELSHDEFEELSAMIGIPCL